MKTFHVTWEMSIDAETPEDAARQALEIHRDPESVATVFAVDYLGVRMVVDVETEPPVILRSEWPGFLKEQQ